MMELVILFGIIAICAPLWVIASELEKSNKKK
jgi:hypothetical protein